MFVYWLSHYLSIHKTKKIKAQKAWIALEASNTPYTLEEISLYGSNGKPSWFLKLNPAGTVPVLNIDTSNGNVVLPDSDLILDYIHDNGLSTSSTSTDTTNKEKIDSWRDIVNTKLIPIGKKAVLSSGSSSSKQKLYDLLSDMDTKLSNEQQQYNNDNKNTKYLCGNEITVADCCLFPFLWRIDQEFGIEEYTNLNQWLHTCCRNEDVFGKTIQRSWWWWW